MDVMDVEESRTSALNAGMRRVSDREPTGRYTILPIDLSPQAKAIQGRGNLYSSIHGF
jgi:hypothetical protein